MQLLGRLMKVERSSKNAIGRELTKIHVAPIDRYCRSFQSKIIVRHDHISELRWNPNAVTNMEMSQSEQAVSGVLRQPLPSIKHQPRFSKATIILFTPATSLPEVAEKQNCALTIRRTKAIRVSTLNEPEARLWKVSAQQGSLGAAIIEPFVLAVFLLTALLLMAGCFVELYQLLQTDALGHVARKALQG
jgi:hypothetical protein